jgi:hypothetical protein
VTLTSRWVTLTSRWVTLTSRWVTLTSRWVTFAAMEAACPGALHHALALAAAISQESPFLSGGGLEEEQEEVKPSDKAQLEELEAAEVCVFTLDALISADPHG